MHLSEIFEEDLVTVLIDQHCPDVANVCNIQSLIEREACLAENSGFTYPDARIHELFGRLFLVLDQCLHVRICVGRSAHRVFGQRLIPYP